MSSFDAKLLDFVQDSLVFQHVSEPTRHRNEASPLLLDIALTNDDSHVYDMELGVPLELSFRSTIRFLVDWEYALAYASTLD